jgi:hypothetical protein
VPDFPLLLDAPDRNWAQHVESLIQKVLGEQGSVSLGLPGERLPSAPGAPRYVVTGIAVCDEPEEEMLAAIRGALADYDVEERREHQSGRVKRRPTPNRSQLTPARCVLSFATSG